MRVRIPAVVLSVAILLSLLVIPASSAEETKLTVSLEFYDASSLPSGDSAEFPGDAEPLEPLQLKEGQRIVAALRYSGLDAYASSGIQSLAVSFTYDYSHFAPLSFSLANQTDPATEWTETGQTAAANWMSSALADGYTASASDRPTEDANQRRVYLQFIGEGSRSSSTIEAASSGYLGAFSFRVKDAFTESDEVYFRWNGVDIALYGDGSFTDANVTAMPNSDLVADTEHYLAPEDVLTAATEVVGVTVSGKVTSYMPKFATTISLLDEGDNVVAEGTIEPTNGMGVVTQDFIIEGVPDGSYKLVITKDYHLSFTKRTLVVGSEDIDLTAGDNPILPTVTLVAGDLNRTKSVNMDDVTVIMGSDNWLSSTPVNPGADLNGSGLVNMDDVSVVMGGTNWLKEERYQIVD